MAAERAALHALAGGGDAMPRATWVRQTLGAGVAPIVAASDYVRAVPELIRAQIDAPYVTLGTDGFGRSDTRAALRSFFEVDSFHVAVNALAALARTGAMPASVVGDAVRKYGVKSAATAPWSR